jgi:hypothetical protein
MTDAVRVLNEQGAKRFRDFLAAAGAAARRPPPFELLTDPAFSADFAAPIEIEREPGGRRFANRYLFGFYLQGKLAGQDRTRISRDHALWNWLSLYYFDQLCPVRDDGARDVLANEIYLLSPEVKHRQYFRHLVRAPWYAVSEHKRNAKVLLIHTERGEAPLATRGAIFEQLASRQGIFGNPTVIAAAQALYFDDSLERPRWGASGNGPGAVRRFALVVQQLELTYDTRACSVAQLLALLPKEFDEWKREADKAARSPPLPFSAH